MARAIVEEQDRAALERDGVAVLRQVVDDRWRERLAQAIERDLAEPGPFTHNIQSDGGRYHITARRWTIDEDVRAFVFESPLPALAAALMQSRKVNLLYDQIFVKEPGTNNPTPWHNDICVYPLEGRRTISFWVALDPVTTATGGLEYIRGSHRWKKNYQTDPTGFGRKEAVYPAVPGYETMPDIDGNRSAYDFASWDMEPGDVLAFHMRTIHGAGGNSSTAQRRRAYSIRYTGDDVTYRTTVATMKVLRNPDLAEGDPLDSPLFPVVWRGGKPVAA